MSLYRRNPKRDITEPAIVQALRQAGFSVQRVSVKDGPDAWIAKGGYECPVEIKTGNAKLRPGQIEWQANWRGAPPRVLRSLTDALAVISTWPGAGGGTRP